MSVHAYAVSNLVSGLAASAFTWSNAVTANRSYLNDGRMDRPMVIGASVASGINVIIDFGSPQQLTGVAVLNSNAAVQKANATLKVEASSSSTFGADVNVAKAASTLYSSALPLDPKSKDHVAQFPLNFIKQYWRLTWTWTGNVTNFQIGELWAFTNQVQLSRRSIYGSGETFDAITSQVEMQYGETRSGFLAGPLRQFDMQWEDLNASERDELYKLHASSYFGAKPLLWIPSYEATTTAASAAEQEVLYGKLQAPRFQFTEKDFGLYQPAGFSVRSLGREAGA